MEKKEYPVPVISGGGDSLEILDPDGNPFQSDDPVNYRIIGEDGEVLKEGTLEEGNLIPLAGVKAKNFRLVLENYFVADIKGIEPPEDETTDDPIESPSEEEGPLERDEGTGFEEEGSFEENAVYADEEGSEGSDERGSGEDSEKVDEKSDDSEDSDKGQAEGDESKTDDEDGDDDSSSKKGEDDDTSTAEGKDDDGDDDEKKNGGSEG